MHRILPIALFSVLLFSAASAQQLPLFTQYMFDPYLINPSMVASGNRAEVNVLGRRQWTQVTDGPKTVQLDVQLPINTKMAFGVNIYNDQTVILNATSVLFTYAYKIQLAPEHRVGFGLSAGVFSNQINISKISASDALDPALVGPSNNMALNGQFGANYTFRNFTFGYSMTNLFDHKTITPDNFQSVKFGTLKNQIFFSSYRFELSPNTWYLQPNVAYRTTQDNLNNWEGSLIVNYANKVDLGGGYRQYFGPTAMVRLTLKQFSAGFAYDFPANKAQVSTGGTQEIQLKWKFGKSFEPAAKKNTPLPPDALAIVPEEKKPEEKIEPVPEKTQVSENSAPTQQGKQEAENAKGTTLDQPVPVPSKADVVSTDIPKANAAKAEVAKTDAIKTTANPELTTPTNAATPLPAAPTVDKPAQTENYYFVIGTFESEKNAREFYNAARKKGLKVEILEGKPGKVPHYYYVHLPQYKAQEISLEKLLELQKTTGYKEAWFTKEN